MTLLETTDRLANAVARMRALTLALDGAPIDDEIANPLEWLAHESLNYLEALAEEFEADRTATLNASAA